MRLPFHDYDDIWFKRKYDAIRPDYLQIRMLDAILRTPSWILVGVRTAFLEKAAKRAHLIIILNESLVVESVRILQRFLSRRLSKRPKKESLKDAIGLIRWNYISHHKPGGKRFEMNRRISNLHKEKVIWLHSKRDVRRFLDSIC